MVELGAAGALDLPEDITGRQLKDTVDDNGSVVEGLLTQFDKERHELVDLCLPLAPEERYAVNAWILYCEKNGLDYRKHSRAGMRKHFMRDLISRLP